MAAAVRQNRQSSLSVWEKLENWLPHIYQETGFPVFAAKTFDYFIIDIYNKFVRQCSVLFGRMANTGENWENMARIVIHKLGPADHCEMEISRFTVLTGAQASGKSTAAKAVFFCRTVKDDIYDIVLRQLLPGTAGDLRNDTIPLSAQQISADVRRSADVGCGNEGGVLLRRSDLYSDLL